MKAATGTALEVRTNLVISIHAAREGGDTIAVSSSWFVSLFQSTPPVKAATLDAWLTVECNEFQSTPPVKAATSEKEIDGFAKLFQSTPPVKAATESLNYATRDILFQSTPPVKAATLLEYAGATGI